MTITRFGWIATFCTFITVGIGSARGDLITVGVSETVLGANRFQYNYTLTNGSSTAITELDIGNNFLSGSSELRVFPVGWTLNGGLQPGTYTSPDNWSLDVITTEGEPTYYLAWSILNTNGNLLPGQTLAGFSVILPREDPAFRTGHWTVILTDASAETGLLQPNVSTVPEPTTLTMLGTGILGIIAIAKKGRRT